jgi:Type III restriction enzyme, res subunit
LTWLYPIHIFDIKFKQKPYDKLKSMPRNNAGESYNSDNTYYTAKEEDDEKKRQRMADCIREVGNWSKMKRYYQFDTDAFVPEAFEQHMKEASPKLTRLFKQISKLDKTDLKKHGKVFKHMIFTDVKNSAYSSKLLASAMIVNGFNPIFIGTKSGLRMKPEDTLLENKGNNFGLLMSKPVFESSMNVKFKKHTLEMFNRRPDNVHGDLVRFIILDQGFKEGIDLYDVKYVHLFEPLVMRADEKQAIGRGTRFCGQKGLEFHPRFGWPLYVFRYETVYDDDMADEFDARSTLEHYLKYSNIDLKKVTFAAEIEKVTEAGAVDKELTESIHKFEIELPPPISKDFVPSFVDEAEGGALNWKPIPPPRIMNHGEMQLFIRHHFKQFTYPDVKLENKCENSRGGASIVEFTPTQEFVRNYFQPGSAYKGLLLFHSVGTGKTCTAIATATSSFEKEDYTILWVTRYTLKSDIWKNMYNQVCSMVIQEKLKNGTLKLPNKISGPMKYLSKNWMEPISYKTFSNMLLKQNKVYDEIVKRNGKEDPLRKTLVIIDEAHKLYAPNVVGAEKPRTDILEKMILNSYNKSGKDSVRVLLMTATPLTEDGMEMVKLLNLLRPEKSHLPADFDDFSDKYLDDDGRFSKKGYTKYLNDISGYVSYLNRSADARNFSYPVLENVVVPFSKQIVRNKEDKVNKFTVKLKQHKQEKKLEIDTIKMSKKQELQAKKLEALAKCKEIKNGAEKQACKQAAAEDYQKYVSEIQVQKENAKVVKSNDLSDCKSLPKNEKKECNDKAKLKYEGKIYDLKVKLAQAKDKKRDDILKCKDVIDKSKECKEKANKQFVEDMLGFKDEQNKINERYEEIIQDVKTEYNNIKEERKNTREKVKELVQRYKDLKSDIKKLEDNKKSELKVLRNIKDKAEKQTKRKQIVLKYVDLKDKKREYKETRDEILKTKLHASVLSEKIGTKFPPDMSQETGIGRCGVE